MTEDDKMGIHLTDVFNEEQLILPSHNGYKPWLLLKNIPSREREAT